MYKGNIILIGPRYNLEHVGGIVVLFEDLVSFCEENNINAIVIDTNMQNYTNKLVGTFSVFLQFLKSIRNVKHVSLHGTAKDYLFIAPIILLISKSLKKEVSLRKFAGSFYDIYSSSNYLSRKIYNYSLKNADYLFFETRYLIEKFKKFNDKVIWWPNSRTREIKKKEKERIFSKRFVFISQVKKTKGVMDFIEVSKKFNESYTFDIYGPIMEDEVEEEINKIKSVDYKGVLNPKEVCKTLLSYDVLVLPTYHEGEGYPGVIIEAFACGIPVISTKWNAIPEIIEDKKNGYLITPQNTKELIVAINNFTEKNYAMFSFNALSSFDNFDSKIIQANFFKTICS